MTNRILERYLDDVAARLSHLAPQDRDGTLSEMRADLEADVARREAEDPSRPRDEHTLAAIEAFGQPDEVAPEPPPVPAESWRSFFAGRTGKLVLLGAALLAILALAAVAVDLAGVGEPVERSLASPYARSAEFRNETGVVVDVFEVPTEITRAELRIQTMRTEGAGCAAVRVVDPDNRTVLDESSACGDLVRVLAIDRPGTWRVEYAFRDFTGSVHAVAGAWRWAG